MSTLDKDQVIEHFTSAYKSAHGKKPTVEEAGGWYSVDDGKGVRLAELEKMAKELSSQSEKSAPASKKEAPKKEAAKKEAPKKEAAKKEAPKKETAKKEAPKKQDAEKAPKKKAAKSSKKTNKSSKASSDFSVKAFWAEKITQQNPGSKLPR